MKAALNIRALIIVAGSLTLPVAACWILLSSTPRIQILDQRFRVLSCQISRGTNHFFFHGNQWEGKLRDVLHQVGFPVKQLPRASLPTKTNTCAFIVRLRYSGEFAVEGLMCLVQAELSDGSGTVIPLRLHAASYGKATKVWDCCWMLDSSPANSTAYHLRLKLRTNSVYVAVVRLGKL